jgi:hypothetical protein
MNESLGGYEFRLLSESKKARVSIDDQGLIYVDGNTVRTTPAGEKLLIEAFKEDKENGIDLTELISEFVQRQSLAELEFLIQEHDRIMEHFKEFE